MMHRAAAPDPKVDRVPKETPRRTTPNAPCNRAQKDYLGSIWHACFSVVRTALDFTSSSRRRPAAHRARARQTSRAAYHLPATGAGADGRDRRRLR